MAVSLSPGTKINSEGRIYRIELNSRLNAINLPMIFDPIKTNDFSLNLSINSPCQHGECLGMMTSRFLGSSVFNDN